MSQILKKKINKDIIISFLKDFCQNEKKKEYIFSSISFKKAEYNKEIIKLIEFLKNHYHKSKQFYLNRQMTYKNFLTILRQICNNLCIPYTSKILYNKSKYNIIYIIFLDDNYSSDNEIIDISTNNINE
jgi:hypothetical protein